MRQKNFDWEYLCENTSITQVFGGWIVKAKGIEADALVFVPDKNHEWVWWETNDV